jgi:phage-related protein
MRLLRIARHAWDIQAVCDARGDCQVLDFLDSLGGDYVAARDAMLSLLQEYLPVHGPQRLREPHSKPLGNELFEFRKEPKGKRLRIIWFDDTGKVVVCASAFAKDKKKTPPEEKERAKKLRAAYFKDQLANKNEIEDL